MSAVQLPPTTLSIIIYYWEDLVRLGMSIGDICTFCSGFTLFPLLSSRDHSLPSYAQLAISVVGHNLLLLLLLYSAMPITVIWLAIVGCASLSSLFMPIYPLCLIAPHRHRLPILMLMLCVLFHWVMSSIV